MTNPSNSKRLATRSLVAANCLVAVLGSTQVYGAKPPLPIPGQLPPPVPGAAVEQERTRPVPRQRGVIETGPVEVRTEAAGGGYVTLRNLSPSRRDAAAPPRFHIQGDQAAKAAGKYRRGDAQCRKPPANPPSAPPRVENQRAAGDYVRRLD